MRSDRFFWCVVPVYLVGLALTGLLFRNALNTDAVAYLRLAEYYSQGKWDLAISGYWGPLTSWFMAVPLKLGCPPLAAGRLFMGLSAIIFFWGCITVYQTFQLPDYWMVTGAVLTALAGVYWSVRFITPDLLLGGLIGFATSRLLVKDGAGTISTSITAGVLWGLAYLAKAVAFPLTILTMLIFAGLSWRNNPPNRERLLRNLAVTFLTFALVAGPWIVVLSLKYHTPIFSTTPRISHALTGPPDIDRYHPFARVFHSPAPGRITDWEEPSQMAYQYWSPLESPAYAWHQVKVIVRNVFICLAVLASVNLAGPLWLLFWMVRRIRKSSLFKLEKWELALIVPILLFGLYLPGQVVLAEQRFFYAAFPFLLVASAGWVVQRREADDRRTKVVSGATIWYCTVLGIVIPLATTVVILGNSPKLAGDCAVDLANRMKRTNLAAPIAGSGMLPGGRTGLYLAFLLDQPWHGDELHPTPDRFRASGAGLAVVTRDSELAATLDASAGFVNLDQKLFVDPEEAGRCPVKVYQINSQPAAPNQ